MTHVTCDLSSTWFLLCRSQDTFICIQNFEHEKNEWPGRESRSRVTAKNVMLTSQASGEFGERRIGVFLLVGFVDRECCWCLFLQFFVSSGAWTAAWFLEVFFFPSHEKFWPCFGDRNPLTGRVVSIRFYVKYTRFNIIIVFNQQCQNPLATAINIDCQTAFFLHPNIEFYQFSCRWYSQSIMWLTLCPSFHVSGLLSIKHVSNIHDWSHQLPHWCHYWPTVLILPGYPSRNCSQELMMTWIQRLET